MKKVILHGELGKLFGKEWKLNVYSPNEAIRALFANNPNIETYLNKKHQEGVFYGVKKAGEGSFAKQEDYPLATEKDLHIFPVPHGSGGFLGSLVMMAVTTAASIYIQQKISEAMERDDATLQAQTQSYIYNGTQNRYQQGSTVPLGYGTMKIGANVVSSCTINYDYNSEIGKIFGFKNGLYSLIPEYDKNYITDLGPLVSCFALNSFDGSSQFRFVDPAFQYLSEKSVDTKFGSTDGIYGGFEPAEKQKDRFTSVEVKGNAVGGYFYYEYNFAKGVDKRFLGNFSSLGNWYPNLLDMSSAEADDLLLSLEARRFAVSEKNALRSAYVCLQSKPVLETYVGKKIFYPISFIEPDAYPSFLDGTNNKPSYSPGSQSFPTHVGQRWRGTRKSNGIGWFKLESTSIIKSIDLLAEGEIDGFADKNGEKLEFDRNHKTNSSDINKIRNEKDDYLQAIFLDETPVKEVNHQFSDIGGLDSYNINEFDIDVGVNSDGSMGGEDQALLEPQYLFTAHTKEIGAQLFGPRSINQNEFSAMLPSNDFEANKIYHEGEYVTHQDDTYIVNIGFDESFSISGNYYHLTEDQILAEESESLIYIGSEENAQFYAAMPPINEYQVFSGEYVDFENNTFYQDGDKVRCPKANGTMRYCKMGQDAERFIGTYSENKDYNGQRGKLILSEYVLGGPNTKSNLYIITGNDNEIGTPLDQIAAGLSIIGENQFLDYSKDPMYMFLNYQDIEELNDNNEYEVKEITVAEDGSLTESVLYGLTFPEEVVKEEVDISPGGSTDSQEGLWSRIFIQNPKQILDENGNNISDQINVFDIVMDSSIEDSIITRFSEENYISHSIINPLVEQAYVTLQIDELGYVYEGDEVNVSYKIGELWTVFLAIIGIYHAFRVKSTASYGLAAFGVGKGAAGAIPSAAGPFANAGAAAALGFISVHGYAAAGWAGGNATASGALILAVATTILSAVLAGHRFDIGTKIENSGETWPNRARFRIKYGNEGENLYSTDVYIFGVATSTYRKDVKIYLPPNPNQRDRILKVYKLNRERNFVKEGEQAARYKEVMSLASVTEITPTILNYAGSAVVGTRINAKDVPNIPDRNYHLRLRKVQIPTNYNAETGVYTGNWNGSFHPELAWTNNPAWCLYDLISNKKFGVGKFGIKEENIDRWTLYKIAKYCDELVLTGYSPKYKKRKFIQGSSDKVYSLQDNISDSQFVLEFGHINKKLAIFHEDGTYESIKIVKTIRSNNRLVLDYEPKTQEFEAAVSIDYPILEPRYTLNAFIMNQDNAFKLINEFAAIFRSYGYWSGGAINFFQDEKKESIMLFSNNNISNEGFSYSSTPKTSRTNSCNIKYIDRYNMYRPKIEHAEDREAISENNYVEQTIDGFGVTSQAQAKRASEFIVKSANLETEIISFTTNMVGSYLKPGDVIDVIDNKRTIGRFAGKIIDIDIHPRGMLAELTLDYPIHTFIDKDDKSTWKNIKIYQPTGNETIESLDGTLDVTDKKIDNMRVQQVGEYLAYDISEDNTKIKLYNNLFEFISGKYDWYEAYRDARARTGQLAIIEDEDSQVLMQSILPTGEMAWLGGFNREMPPPEKVIWHNSNQCGDNMVKYESWASGYPKFADPLETDEINEEYIISTDRPEEEGFAISADASGSYGSFIATSGSDDVYIHGDWIHMSGNIETGYIYEKANIGGLERIENSEGTTFAMEDSSNFAQTKQYKVINITEETNGIFRINGLEYSADKFDNIEKNLSIKKPEGPVIYNDKNIYNRD
jgi:predicted phage tail protein